MSLWYRTGTVSVTNGSMNVVGVGTSATINFMQGDAFTLDGSKWYEIDVISDDTHWTLKAPGYTGTTLSGQSFAVMRNYTSQTNAVLADRLTTLLNSWQTREDQFAAWNGGTPTGGVNSDGMYPLANAVGNTQNVACPAKIASFSTNFSNALTTVGDMIVAGASATPARLASVAIGNVLLSGGVGVAPAWGKIGLTTHVAGILPVANGGTGVGTATGTGNLVLANSPTISGLTVSDTLTVNTNAFLVNANKRVLIGTTTDDGVNLLQVAGSGIVHGKLDVHPSVGGGALVVGGWDAIGQTGATLTLGGITASQWDTLALYASGSERMRIASSGNVLIGTTYDDGVNMMRIAGGISSNSWLVSKDKPNTPASTGVNLNSISIGKDGTAGMGWIQSYGSSGVQATQINPMGGSVLIGTTTNINSAYELQVNGHVYSTGNLCLYPGTGNRTKIYMDDPGYLTWIIGAGTTAPGYLSITRTSGGTDGLSISNMGHTLIGSATDNGVDQLQVNGSISNTTYIDTPRIRVIKDGSSTQTDALQVKNTAGTQYIGWQLGSNGSADLYNTLDSGGSWTKLCSYSSTVSFINPSGGNVIIGTTTNDGVNKLQVNGSVKAAGIMSGAGLVLPGYVLKNTASATVTISSPVVIFQPPSTCSVTMPYGGGSNTGFIMYLVNYSYYAINSVTSDIVGIDGTVMSAILPAGPGKWAILQGESGYWRKLASN